MTEPRPVHLWLSDDEKRWLENLSRDVRHALPAGERRQPVQQGLIRYALSLLREEDLRPDELARILIHGQHLYSSEGQKDCR